MSKPLPQKLKLHGINFDLESADLTPDKWTGGRNVFFKAGETWRIRGNAPFPATNSKPTMWKWIWFVDTGVAQWWIGAGAGGVAVTDGTTVYDVTPTGWIAPLAGVNVQVGDINTVPFVNHPAVGPFYWNLNPAAKCLPLPGWPTNWRAGVMRAHKNFLLAGNIDTGAGLQENQVSWSTSAVPGDIPITWTPSVSNDAGDVEFSVPGGPILDMISIRDQVFVSKQHYTGAMQYTGGQYVFQKRDVFPKIGIFATGSQVEYGGIVYVFTGSMEVISHDGNAPTNISLGAFQDYIRKAINMQYPDSVFLYRDDDQGQVVIAYPTSTTDACTEGLSIEIATGDIAPRDLSRIYSVATGLTGIVPSTWNADSQAWQDDTTTWNEAMSGYQPWKIVYGMAQGMVEEGAGPGLWMGGVSVPINAYVERVNLDFGDWEHAKVLLDFWPLTDGSGATDTMTYKFGCNDTPNQGVNWNYQRAFNINDNTSQDLDQAGLNGRLIAFGYASNGGSAWRQAGLRLNMRLGGVV